MKIRNILFLWRAIRQGPSTLRPDQIYSLFHFMHVLRGYKLYKYADMLRKRIQPIGHWWKDVSDTALKGYWKTLQAAGPNSYPSFPPLSVKHDGLKMSFNRDGSSELEGAIIEDKARPGKETEIYLKLSP